MINIEKVAFTGKRPWWWAYRDEIAHWYEAEFGVEDVLDLMQLADMVDDNIMFRPVYFKNELGEYKPMAEYWTKVRARDGQAYGVFKDNAVAFQPWQAEKLAQYFVDASNGELKPDVACSLGNGNRGFINLHAGKFEVLPGDEIKRNFLVSWSHDGSQGVCVGPVNERSVCENTLRIALAEGSLFKTKQTTNLEIRLEDIKKKLVRGWQALDETEGMYKTLANVPLKNEDDLKEYAKAVLAPPQYKMKVDKDTGAKSDTKQMQTLLDTIVDNFYLQEIQPAYQSGSSILDTIVGNFEGEKGRTWWHGYNAVTEYLTHQAPEKGMSRMESLMFNGTRARQNENALAFAYDRATGKTVTVRV